MHLRVNEQESGRFTSANFRFYVADLICTFISILSETSGKWQSMDKNGTNPQKRIKNINKSLKNHNVDRSMFTNLNFSLIFLQSACEGWGTRRNRENCAAGLQRGWGTGCIRGLWRLEGRGRKLQDEAEYRVKVLRPTWGQKCAPLTTGVLSEIWCNEQYSPPCPTVQTGNPRALAARLKRPQTEDWPIPLWRKRLPLPGHSLRTHQSTSPTNQLVRLPFSFFKG